MADVPGDVHHVGLSYLCGLRKKEKRGSHLHTNNNTRWHFPRFEKRTFIYCFLLVFVNSFGSSSSSSSIIWERERESERVKGRDGGQSFNFLGQNADVALGYFYAWYGFGILCKKFPRNLQSNGCVDIWMRWPGNDFKLSFDANKQKKLFLDVALRASSRIPYLIEIEIYLLKIL